MRTVIKCPKCGKVNPEVYLKPNTALRVLFMIDLSPEAVYTKCKECNHILERSTADGRDEFLEYIQIRERNKEDIMRTSTVQSVLNCKNELLSVGDYIYYSCPVDDGEDKDDGYSVIKGFMICNQVQCDAIIKLKYCEGTVPIDLCTKVISQSTGKEEKSNF